MDIFIYPTEVLLFSFELHSLPRAKRRAHLVLPVILLCLTEQFKKNLAAIWQPDK